MKRAALFLSLGMIAGCSQNQQGTPSTTSNDGSSSTSAKPAMQYPSHEGEPSGMYYENTRDGNLYVTGYVATATMIRHGEVPPGMVEKENFGPEGQTVYFEDDGKGLAQRLEKDYLAQHKK